MESVVFGVFLPLALLLAPPSELEWFSQESCHCEFYVVQFFPYPPLEIPLYSTSEDCMC